MYRFSFPTALLLAILALTAFSGNGRAIAQTSDLSASSTTAPAASAEIRNPKTALTTDTFEETASAWDLILGSVDSYVAGGKSVKNQTALYSELLSDVHDGAVQVRDSTKAAIVEQNALLEALGAPPEDGLIEPEDVAVQRADYQAVLDQNRSALAHAEVAILRAETLKSAMAGLSREQLASKLNQQTGRPWSLEHLGAGFKALVAGAVRIFTAPATWRASLSDSAWQSFASQRLPMLLGLLAGATIVGLLARILLTRFFGYATGTHGLTKARRLGAAAVRMAADGLIPTLWLVLLVVWAEDAFANQGAPLLLNTIRGAAIALICLSVSLAGISATLTPQHSKWRSLPVSDEAAYAIRRLVMILAIFVATDLFLWNAFTSEVKTPELLTVYALISCIARTLAILPLLHGRLWRLTDPAPDPGALPKRPSRLWLLVRLMIGAMTIASVIAAATGYSELALFIVRGLTASLVVVSGLFMLRGAAHEAISTAMSTPAARAWLGVREETSETLSFWARVMLEPAFVAAGIFFLGPFWGVTRQEMATRGGALLQGFKVGDVTISLTAIGLGVLAFILMLALTRAIQRAMLTKLLPRTRLDIGAQHSLTTGLGYIGAILAGVVGISALGIDLSNLAIVAGALSVGIGFGLQSIVNNFVSGLILLVERPVKVGDWIIVGDRQGIVKRIAIRATEVETFDRSSVIIPNSDLISNPVINRTHKDRHGRVEIPVGVAYGSDTRRVHELLIEIGKTHAEVLLIPEPFAVFIGFGDSSLDFELRVYTANNLRGMSIATELRHVIHERFAAEGVEIPFPQRVLHMAQAPASEEEDSSETSDKDDSAENDDGGPTPPSSYQTPGP